MMTSSPGSISAMNTDAIASVAPQQTVISLLGSTAIWYHCWYLCAIALRSVAVPHVTAYWLMSALMAVHAASFMGSGIGKSGNPCARFTASWSCAMRVISRITDSVNVAVRLAACMRKKLWLAGNLRQSAANEVGGGETLAIFLQRHSHGALG